MKLVAVGLTAFVLLLLAYQANRHEKWLNFGDRYGVPNLGPASARPVAQDFSVMSNGLETKLVGLRGKAVYINFWAMWCAPCLTELPIIEKIQQENSASLAVILINVDSGEKNLQEAREFQMKNAPTPLALFDEPTALANMLNITALPGHIFLDKEGRVAAAFVGTFEKDMGKFQTLIQQLVAE